MASELSQLILPESELEQRIISDPEFIRGTEFGEPRPGHPEGKVLYHISSVLQNISKYSNPQNRSSLRLVGLAHDTFKYKVNSSAPKTGENHHGMIARRFLERFVQEENVLIITEMHDHAYNAWRMIAKRGESVAEAQAKFIINQLKDNVELYLLFYKCDNETGDKSPIPYQWFERILRTKVLQSS